MSDLTCGPSDSNLIRFDNLLEKPTTLSQLAEGVSVKQH
jgi:hypothetical protein